MSLAVVFECGHVARVFAMFDNNSHGEGRTADVSALFARMLLANEVAYLVAVDDVLGFLEASARPVPAGRVVLNPATVGCVGDVFEGFVDGEHYLRGPFLRGRAYSLLLVVLYHVPSLFADAGVAVLLLVARSVVNLAHHECHHERVNAGNGAACVVSGDGDGRS